MGVRYTSKFWRGAYAVLLAVTPTYSALAVEGVITERLPNCAYFIVKTDNDYAVMEWNGEVKPERNDRLSGNFSAGTMNVLQNVTRGEKVKVWIEGYPFGYDEAIKIFRDECQ